MVATLVLAFYGEGPSDERFLPIVIQRTAEQLLIQRGRTVVDVLEPMVLKPSIDGESTGAERILAVARRASGYHALIIHADADYPIPERALNERIRPGLDLVRQTREPVCNQLVPLIPVQMTEAWMLADSAALQVVVGTNLEGRELGLPEHAKEVESFSNPKHTLSQVIQLALANRPRRRRHLDIRTVYEPLARQISLARLDAVPAYRQFIHAMAETLIALNLIY